MANTHRDNLNYQRRHRAPSAAIGDYSDCDADLYPRPRGGNMVMAASASGIWWDERPQRGRDRDAQRRNQKRRERQQWKTAANV